MFYFQCSQRAPSLARQAESTGCASPSLLRVVGQSVLAKSDKMQPDSALRNLLAGEAGQ